MGKLFDKLFGKGKAEKDNDKALPVITAAPSSHICEDVFSGDDDKEYRTSFSLNDSFKPAKSHAAEVWMLNTYAPDEEYGSEEDDIYVAIQWDDDVYSAVEELREGGETDGVSHFQELSGKFLFRARMEYYGSLMYFYGLDRCDGLWENNGLCMVYPAEYDGTDAEKTLMKILDLAAESYKEELISE